MSLMQLPPTRPPRRSVFGQDSALTSNNNGVEHRQSLLAVQPRRARRPQLASRWDSTFDIFTDPLDAHEAQNQEATFSKGSLSSTHQVAVRGGAVATDDAMAQASKREFLCETAGNAANTQKKRTSLYSLQSTVMEEPPQSPVVVINRPMLNADRAARRRTIYVPPDDTTIMTIHPGAPSRRAAGQGRPPRRSDVFLDLATLSESSILEEGQGTNKTATPSDRKRSMAILPKRGPLRQCARPLQGSAFQIDIPGSGGGKENIPPMYRMDRKKGKLASASTPSSRLGSKLPNTSTCRIPTTTVSQHAYAATTHNAYVDHSTPVRNNRLQAYNYSSPLGPVSPKVAKIRPLQSTAPPTISASPRVFFRPERTPSKLSVPLLPQHHVATPKQYRVLTEHVSNTDLYEEQWLNHQEAAITGLMNELFDGSTTRVNPAIASYGSMRTSLMKHYDTEDVAQLHKRLQASLRFGALSISAETLARVGRLKDDIGQSRAILETWLKTYDPAILQAAAEVVIGREIGLSTIHSSPSFKTSTATPKKSKALDGFLLSCLLRNEDVASGGTGLSISGPNPKFDSDVGGLAWSWRRTLVRSLLIIHVIDKAASSGTLNQCVFQASSLHKSSVSVLQALTNMLLPSIGAVTRVLGRLSYHLSHVQYPLQEYNYTIQNLATDLRDGVRLTRLVEILLYPAVTDSKQDRNDTSTLQFTLPIQPNSHATAICPGALDRSWPLSQHLKYPCTGRVQKLYNVRIALEALKGAKNANTAVDCIEAQDIVDGHREKTVGMLWSLVGRWGLSLLVDFDALVVEINRLKRKWWRSCVRSGKVSAAAQEVNCKKGIDLFASTASDLDSQTALLLSWSSYVGKFYNVDIENLSTSFADGRAYQAIVDEYAQYLPAACPQKAHLSTSSATSTMQTHLHSTLRNLGCSNSFIALFPATASTCISASHTPSIPSKQTTIPLLAFLASRLLPAARPHIAALKLQSWWRSVQRVKNARQVWGALPAPNGRKEIKVSTGEVWRQRGVKARLARECRDVVVMRDRIERAAIVVQRLWRRRGLKGQSMRSRTKG